jgi:hypothetical protein
VRHSINLNGALLLVTYSDNTTEFVQITEDMVTGFDTQLPVENQILNIRYNDFSMQVVIKIIEDNIVSVSLLSTESGPIVLRVKQGAELDLSDLTLRRLLKSGQSVDTPVDSTMLTGYTKENLAGNYTVIVKYDNFEATFSVIVESNNIVPSATYITAPTKQSYYLDDTYLDLTGLILHLVYEDQTELLIPYTDESKSEFEISYNLNVERRLSPVTVKYIGSYSSGYDEEFASSFSIEVKSPLCTNMVFSYTNADGQVVDGTPKTLGIKIDDVVFVAPSPITAVVEGDVIDWSSGSALVSYENGKQIIVKLNDPIMQRYTQEEGTYDVDTSQIGNHTVWFKYGNVSWQVSMNITVIQRTPKELLLSNTEYLTEPVHPYGTQLIYNLVRYNVLYNNGEYLYFDGHEFKSASSATSNEKRVKADELTWGGVTIDMLTGSSNLTINSDNVVDNIQTIGFRYIDKIKNLDLKVEPVKATALSILRDPIKNYYVSGTAVSNLDFTSGMVLVNYNNGTSRTYNIADTDIIKKVYTDSNKLGLATNLNNSEEKVYLNHTTNNEVSDYYIVETGSDQIASVALAKPLTNVNYIDFEQIPFNTLHFIVYKYEDDDLVNEEIAIDPNKHIYYADRTKLGYQEIILRFFGFSVKMAVNITGRRASSFDIISSPQTIYFIGIHDEISFDGLKVRKQFNDQSTFEEVSDFDFDGDWSYDIVDKQSGSLSNVVSVGTKQVTLYYFNGIAQIAFSYDIIVLKGSSIISIEVENNSDENRLFVQYAQELNLYGLKLKITYSIDSNTTATTNIDLLRSYVEYDASIVYQEIDKESPQGDLIPVVNYELVVRFPSKELTLQTALKVKFVNLVLKSIEIYEYPTIRTYPINAELSLSGGILKRNFDGYYDYISMTNSSVYYENYTLNPFDQQQVEFVVQAVRIIHSTEFVELSITTYRLLDASKTMQLINGVSYYGNTLPPEINLQKPEGLNNFELPNFKLYYKDSKGDWILVDSDANQYPLLPGTYELKVDVEENLYYAGGEILDLFVVKILKKEITILINSAQKTYRSNDPLFTYSISDDALIEINGVKDRIELNLYRDSGENVLYTGDILSGYTIRASATAGLLQNDYYIFHVDTGTLYINPFTVDRVTFYGYLNLKADGNDKVVTAYYETGFSSLIPISESDIVYSRYAGSGYIDIGLGYYPVESGQYMATISKNYIVKEGFNYITFTISN